MIITKDMESALTNAKREQLLRRAGITGIAVNALLAAAKMTVGLISNSVSIISDSVNNFSDCITSLITVVSARRANRMPDRSESGCLCRTADIGADDQNRY
jgi:divalent metal cation (Fe/Co/Zn/Cd) transporter